MSEIVSPQILGSMLVLKFFRVTENHINKTKGRIKTIKLHFRCTFE